MWGIGTALSGAVKAVGNKAKTIAASTSVGKSYGIKPELKEKIASGRTAISDAQKELNKIKSIKKIPALNKALNELAKQGNLLIADLLADKNLDPIVNIIGDHINEYSSVEEFKKTVLEKPALIEMKDFALGLIDVDNYQNLATLMKKLQNFSTLPSTEQRKLFASLEDGQLVARITNENRALNLDTAKTKTKVMCTALCRELKLTETETKTLISLFDSLTSKYLPEVNRIRQSLLNNFPALIKAEAARILSEHPELAVQTTASSKPALTTQFTELDKPKKAVWRLKKAETKAEEVVVKKEDAVEKKPTTKRTPKKAAQKEQPVVIILDDEEDVKVVEKTSKTKKKAGKGR